MASLMDESTGNVQRMVQQMQHRLVPGESARDRGRSIPLPHGSAEHGAGSRRNVPEDDTHRILWVSLCHNFPRR